MIRHYLKNLWCLALAMIATSASSPASETFSVFPLTDSGLVVEPNVNKFDSKDPSSALRIAPNGAITNPGWALARLNDGESPENAPSYLYPETSRQVRVYLIDTSVDNTSGWFNANPNLTIRDTVLVHDLEESTGATYFEHATRMLSVIAGPETGAALGTPIEVVNYDIYPSGLGGTTVPNLLISAIIRAVEDYEENPEVPSLICIAAGSVTPGEDVILESYIQFAVASGLPVITSAGNSSADATGFVPASYGTIDGVICVGASDQSNNRLALSNFGAPVDIYAPGSGVRTLKFPNPASGQTDTRSGTSYSAAMATATALATLSMQPEYSPQDLEAALKDDAFPAAESIVQLPPVDSDGDGIHDTIENFFGANPLNSGEIPELPILTGSPASGGSTALSLDFVVDASRLVPGDPYNLSDGTTWQVLKSTDLMVWTPVTVSPQIGTTTGNKTNVSVTTSSSDPNCYFKVEIVAP